MTNTDDNGQAGVQGLPALDPSSKRADAFEQRRTAIKKYASEAFGQSNTLIANLELVNGDLMQMMLWFREDLERLREQPRDPVESLEILMPISEQFYKLTKQLHAFADLENRFKQSEQAQAATAKQSNQPKIVVTRKKPR